MKIKQIITYTNGQTTEKYFDSETVARQSASISMCSPYVKCIENRIISEEEYDTTRTDNA